MAARYSCPNCRVTIEYRPNRWAPWRANEPFRCRNCSAMVQLRPTAATQLIRVLIFVVLLGGEAVVFLFFGSMSKFNLVWLGIALVIACGLLLLRVMQLLHLVLPHRLVVCRDN